MSDRANTCPSRSRRRDAAWGAAAVMIGVAAPAAPSLAVASDRSAARSAEALPASVEARYRLLYNGIGVGHLTVNSKATGQTYALSGSGKVSALFGAMKWSGSSNVSGELENGAPSPQTYAFDWRHNRKSGEIKLKFQKRTATDVSVTPPPGPHPDLVPLAPPHKNGVLDPVSALLALTRVDRSPPCDRRVAIFDGKQRYDIVLTPKRTTTLASISPSGGPETAHVCRAMYVPVAGHRDNDATRTYAANRDVEVVMRRVPGVSLFVPYSVTVPTAWGTGSMVTERIEIVTPSAERIALTK